MKLKLYYDNILVNMISDELRIKLESRVEMQLLEAVTPYEKLISLYNYTFNIYFSENYETLLIVSDGFPTKLASDIEQAIAKVISEKPVFIDRDFISLVV